MIGALRLMVFGILPIVPIGELQPELPTPIFFIVADGVWYIPGFAFTHGLQR